MKEYKSESSINKMLAQLQIANAAVACDCKCNEEAKFEVLLREALKSENEAIEIYLKLEKKAKEIGSKPLAKAFKELSEDEQKHVGSLNFLLEIFCIAANKKEEEGKIEEIKLQSEQPE